MSRAGFGLSVILCLLTCASVLGVRAEARALDSHQAMAATSLDPSVLAQEAPRYLVWVGIALAGLVLIKLIAQRLGRGDETQAQVQAMAGLRPNDIVDVLITPQSPEKALEDLKNEILDRRNDGRPGLLTEWVNTQSEFPTPDHVPVERAVDVIFSLYGGVKGIMLLFNEGLMEYLAIDVVQAFGTRAERIVEVMTSRMIEDAG